MALKTKKIYNILGKWNGMSHEGRIRMVKFMAVGVACKATFWPTPVTKIEKFWRVGIIRREDLKFCLRCTSTRIGQRVQPLEARYAISWQSFIKSFSLRDNLTFNFVWNHTPDWQQSLCCPDKSPRELTFTWWGCCGLRFWHKPNELAHSFSFCSCVYICIYGPFNCISFHKFSRQLSVFSLCSSGLYESLLQPWYNPLWLTGLKAPTN